MSQRRTYDIPVPQTRKAWVNSALVAGAQLSLLLLAVFGIAPWWAAIGGILSIEIGFRVLRNRLAMAAQRAASETEPERKTGA